MFKKKLEKNKLNNRIIILETFEVGKLKSIVFYSETSVVFHIINAEVNTCMFFGSHMLKFLNIFAHLKPRNK